jgi:hypothetical protein
MYLHLKISIMPAHFKGQWIRIRIRIRYPDPGGQK